MDEKRVLRLVERIYEAPADAASWQRLVGDLAGVFGSEYFHMIVFDGTGRWQFDAHTSFEARDIYVEHYAAVDTALDRHLRGPHRRAATERDWLSADELKTSPVEQEMNPQFGVASRLWVKSPIGEGMIYGSGAIRMKRQGAFDETDHRLAETLHPHIERALRLQRELDRAASLTESLEAGIETLVTGIAVLHADGTVIAANRAARMVLDARDGLRLERGRIAAVAGSAHSRLQRVMAAALGRSGVAQGGGVVIERLEGRPLVVRILPLRQSQSIFTPRAVAVALIHDPGREAPVSPEAIAALGLTPAEARLLAAIIDGHSLDEYAAAVGLRLSTVRSTLKHLFMKTDTHRQAELVALMSRFATQM